MATEPLTFVVTDLKQYAYCPRVVYYTYCLPLLRPMTFKMERGIASSFPHPSNSAPGKARSIYKIRSRGV